MRLLALVPKPLGTTGSQRYRLEQWAPYLRSRHIIDLDFAVFESSELTTILYTPGRYVRKAVLVLRDFVRRRHVLRVLPQYDGVVIHREAALLGPAIYEWIIASKDVPIVFDFDDAIWLQPSWSVNGFFSRFRFPSKTATICRLASAVSVGNDYLAAYARRQGARNIAVVPSTIDLARYPVQPRPPREPFVIIWSGSHSTMSYLDIVRGAVEHLAHSRSVIVKVICDVQPKPFGGAETRFIRWREASEAEDVGAAHVGIMPLPDDEFTRGKCALKALQYMATGLPVIVSPVGVNAQIIRHGENGLWARNTAEWVDALERVASNPELAARLGRAGRETVERGFTAEIGADAFAQAVRTALKRT